MHKFCLITGATGGIGRALVTAFHQAGYQVIATDLGEQPPELPCAHYLRADLNCLAEDEAATQTLVTNIRACLASQVESKSKSKSKSKGQGLNLLINNAATQKLAPTDTLSRADWQQTLNVNLTAPFLLTQALLPELEAACGCVINIGSIHARLTKRRFVAYATSKAALAGLTRALAVDLGPRIRVNAIEPAAIDTPMLRAGFDGQPALYQQLEHCHPRQRIGQPAEVARLALALAAGELAFLSGSCIGLDGGISARLFDPD